MGSLALWVPIRFTQWGALAGHGTQGGEEGRGMDSASSLPVVLH